MFLGLCPSSNVSKNTAFRKVDLFPSSGKIMAGPTPLGPLERAGNAVFLETLDDGQRLRNMILPSTDSVLK
jgi:hypothetical protein